MSGGLGTRRDPVNSPGTRVSTVLSRSADKVTPLKASVYFGQNLLLNLEMPLLATVAQPHRQPRAFPGASTTPHRQNAR